MTNQWMESRYTLNSLIARSSAMRNLVEDARDVAKDSGNVLIHGPAGSGKKLIARAIHESSDRSGKPFVTVHCDRLTIESSEAILCGGNGQRGLIEEAAGGTLLLAGIENLIPVVQERLLKIIQDNSYINAEGKRCAPQMRIMATAECEDIDEQLKRGQFSRELFTQFSKNTLCVPSLAERQADIPFLVKDLLERFAQRERITMPTVPYHYMEMLTKVSWPENIRQLRNHLESVMVLSEGQFQPEVLLAHFDQIQTPATIKGAFQSLLGKLHGLKEANPLLAANK
jgi:DNA-binding NtrC family response regulator